MKTDKEAERHAKFVHKMYDLEDYYENPNVKGNYFSVKDFKKWYNGE